MTEPAINDIRAGRAQDVLVRYMNEMTDETKLEEALPLLIADIRHLCDARQWDFERTVRKARDYYQSELKDGTAQLQLAVLHIKERGRNYYFILNSHVGNLEFYIGKGQRWRYREPEAHVLTRLLETTHKDKTKPITLADLPVAVRSILATDLNLPEMLDVLMAKVNAK